MQLGAFVGPIDDDVVLLDIAFVSSRNKGESVVVCQTDSRGKLVTDRLISVGIVIALRDIP